MNDVLIVWSIFIGAVVASQVFKYFHPYAKYSCMVGLHNYSYSHEKHGMHMDKGKVVGTRRRIHTCCCGKEKGASKQDWIK